MKARMQTKWLGSWNCVGYLCVCLLAGCGCNKPEVSSGSAPAPSGGSSGVASIPAGDGGSVSGNNNGTPPPLPSTGAAGNSAADACDVADTRSLRKRDATRRIDTKIVGGSESPKLVRRWMAAITTDGNPQSQYCGGTLIAKDWVLTAAHCRVATSDKIILGRQDLNDQASGKVVSVKDVKIHGRYDEVTHDLDVSLVRIEDAPDLPIMNVLEGSGDLAAEPALVVGWGYVKEGGPLSSKLREVTVPVVGNGVCTDGYQADHVVITRNMLCAGLAIGGKDSCQGDSGGPLLVTENNKLVQAGIVSFGVGCARPNRYGVYTRVSQVRSWIKACMR